MNLAEITFAAMTWLEPTAAWRGTYRDTANALADEAEAHPLWVGKDGALRTIAIDLSIGWFESTLDPSAEGDCQDKDHRPVPKRRGELKCPPDSTPQSLGFFQIGVSNLAGLGAAREDLMSIVTATPIAHVMIRSSFAICRGRPEDDLLANYAYGQGTCGGPMGEGIPESKNRMAKARGILVVLRRLRDANP